MQEVQLKTKIIENLKTPLQSVSPLMGSSGGVKTKQKQNGNVPQHINCV